MIKTIKHGALIATLIIGSTLSSMADVWLTDFEAAKTEAAARKVPILANFSGSDWCKWCIKLDKEVFSQPEFMEYAQKNLVLLDLDFPMMKKKQSKALAKQNKDLAEKYGIQGFPTVLILDATGKRIGKLGYRKGGPEIYIEILKNRISKATTSSPKSSPAK